MGALFVLGHDYSKWGFWFELGFQCGKAVQVESLDNVKTFLAISVIMFGDIVVSNNLINMFNYYQSHGGIDHINYDVLIIDTMRASPFNYDVIFIINIVFVVDFLVPFHHNPSWFSHSRTTFLSTSAQLGKI